MATYWMDLPSKIVSSLLGLGDEFIAEEGALDDIPENLREDFVVYLSYHSGDAEYYAKLFLEEVAIEAKEWLQQFLWSNDDDIDDYEHKLWYKNIPDEMAHEEAFGLIGGVPEYNELALTYIPDMLHDTGIEADDRAVLDDLIKTVQQVDDAAVKEAVQDLWQEAKQHVLSTYEPIDLTKCSVCGKEDVDLYYSCCGDPCDGSRGTGCSHEDGEPVCSSCGVEEGWWDE